MTPASPHCGRLSRWRVTSAPHSTATCTSASCSTSARSRTRRRSRMRDELRQLFGIDLVIRLRDVRLMCGLTQAEMAKQSGVGEKTISSYETGARIDKIKVVHLLKILSVY